MAAHSNQKVEWVGGWVGRVSGGGALSSASSFNPPVVFQLLVLVLVRRLLLGLVRTRLLSPSPLSRPPLFFFRVKTFPWVLLMPRNFLGCTFTPSITLGMWTPTVESRALGVATGKVVSICRGTWPQVKVLRCLHVAPIKAAAPRVLLPPPPRVCVGFFFFLRLTPSFAAFVFHVAVFLCFICSAVRRC